jgi:hypothetical protein
MSGQPGQSGNPNGRRKADVGLRDLAREHTTTALETLVAIMTNPKATCTSRVAAANALLDRGYGRPESSVNAKVETKQTWGPDALDKLPAAERAEVARHAKEWGPALDRWALLIGADENGNGNGQSQ